MFSGPIILDVGGEGRYRRAWNVNPSLVATRGTRRGQPIARLIVARGEALPLATASVQLVIVERTPLRVATLREMGRVLAPGGRIVLRCNPGRSDSIRRRAEQNFLASMRERTKLVEGQLLHEFTFVASTPASEGAIDAD